LIAEDLERAGFALLKPRAQYQENMAGQGLLSDVKVFSYGMNQTDRYVDGEKVQRRFFGQMQRFINDSAILRNKVKLIAHGPATQMDVYPDSGLLSWGPKFYSVDVVPAFEVDGYIYVAKPIKNGTMPSCCWRRSYSVQEKNKLIKADAGNQSRKKVFRILKVIRNREPGLSLLTSYHLKTALFWEMDEESAWTCNDLGRRLMGVLGQLEQALWNGTMPHYYIAGLDLLMDTRGETVTNMRCRIHRMRTNKRVMMSILNA